MAPNGQQDLKSNKGPSRAPIEETREPHRAPFRMKRHLRTEISTAHADTLLLTCCLISGLVDSTVFNAYGTFVSMQTGNTIFLGLGGSTGHSTSQPYGWAKSSASIVFFCLGCLFFSRSSKYLGPLRRGTLVTSFVIQAVIVIITAALIQGGFVSGSLNVITDEINWRELLPITLLSFQAAGQIVESRALDLSEIPTVVVTSVMHDIFADLALLAPLSANAKRNRRIGAFASILVGAVAGGYISESTRRIQISLWIAGASKLLVACAWLVWPARRDLAV